MKHKLIILAEVGFIPFSQRGALKLFSFISQRYQRGSSIVTSNLGLAEWTGGSGEPRLTSALLDRLTHRCHVLELTGKSYRFRQSMRRQAGSSDPLTEAKGEANDEEVSNSSEE